MRPVETLQHLAEAGHGESLRSRVLQRRLQSQRALTATEAVFRTDVEVRFGDGDAAAWAERAGAEFVGGGAGADPSAVVFDALAATANPPKTIAIVTSKFPSVHHISGGAREVLKKRGLQLVLDVEYEFGNRDFGPIASRVASGRARSAVA